MIPPARYVLKTWNFVEKYWSVSSFRKCSNYGLICYVSAYVNDFLLFFFTKIELDLRITSYQFTSANTSTLNHHRQQSSTLFQRWYLVENESWADVHLSTLFQRWQNNIKTTLIELRRFKVDEPTLLQRWNSVENGSWADVCLLTKQRWNNVHRVTWIQCWWHNLVSTSILGWKEKLSQRMFIGVEKTALKQLCPYLLYWGSL